MVVAPLGTLLGEWLRGRPVDPSVLLGSALGTLVAASIMAFPVRVNLRDRAGRRATGPGAGNPDR